MEREFQEPFPPIAELSQKADTLEKLSAERSELAKRIGIEGKVKAHSSLETAQRVGRVRAKLELSAEIFSLKATALRNELEAYEKAPGIMAEWERRGEAFTAPCAEQYRGRLEKRSLARLIGNIRNIPTVWSGICQRCGRLSGDVKKHESGKSTNRLTNPLI